MEAVRVRPIIMFPFLAEGHIIPFMNFAKMMEQQTQFPIVFVSTPLNVQRLTSFLSPTSNIRLESLPFNSTDHGLPPDNENTNAVSLEHRTSFTLATETLQPAFENLIVDVSRRHGVQPLCIIADPLVGWTVSVARSLGVYHAALTTCGAYGTAAYFSAWLNLPHCKTDADDFHLPGFPDTVRLSRSQLSVFLRAADGTDPLTAFFQCQIRLTFQSDCMLCNSVEELELTGLEVLRKMVSMPVFCIGPLLPPFLLQDHPVSPSLPSPQSYLHHREAFGVSFGHCIEWLDHHTPASVLYVSFGSQNTISVPQITALATGLEESGRPFIWVIRPPLGEEMSAEYRGEGLPPRFEERMAEQKRGLLVRNWAPQVEILSHRSTGAFLSHCGWNSVLESMSQGVPIIAWPIGADQFTNSKMMEEELGVSVELARGVTDEITSERVRRAIRTVMDGTEECVQMKRKAEQLRRLLSSAVHRGRSGGRRRPSLDALQLFIRAAGAKPPGTPG